jgi:hypothetical protein
VFSFGTAGLFLILLFTARLVWEAGAMTTIILWCVGGVLGAFIFGAVSIGFESHRRFGAQLEKSPRQNKQS